jgi:hypothetical protein
VPRFKPPKSFYLVVIDEDRGSFTVEGPMSDDGPWNHAVVLAQEDGRKVRCWTATRNTREEVVAATQGRFGKLVESGTIVRRGGLL